MQKITLIVLSLLSISAFAEPRLKYLTKAEGKGQFVKDTNGREYCTHNKTSLAFTQPLMVSIGFDVLNKNSGEMAHYYYTGQYNQGSVKFNLFEKIEGSSQFSKYIGINNNTYYFDNPSYLATAEVDVGFRYMKIADINKGSSTLYCTKK